MSFLLLPVVAVPAALLTGLQDDRLDALEARMQTLEQDNQRLSSELQDALDALAEAEVVGGADATPFDPELTETWAALAQRRLAPRAAAVYTADRLSFGGYGEFLAEEYAGRDDDRFDALRWVMYFGSRFSDRWIFNSEIEIEHGSTDASSATTDSNGSVSIEFAYIDHLLTDQIALRGGVVLAPMGFVNERHEPTTFLPAARPQTETRIIPSTWRTIGVGGYGQSGPFAWTAYAINGLAGGRFDASGLRGGRQKGNRASSENVALVGRLDYVDVPGLVAGVSAFQGNSGADQPEGLGTTIVDLHAEWNEGPWSVRGLFARADVDDTAAFNARTGEALAERLEGWYVEAGFDLLSLTDVYANQTLDVFFRYEDIDTQAELAPGTPSGGGIDDTFLTYGLNYRPLDQVVLKLDYTDVDEGDDVVRALIGYAF